MDTFDYIAAKERLALFKPKKYALWRRLINQFKNKEHHNQQNPESSRC
jgi:hypothetical protein